MRAGANPARANSANDSAQAESHPHEASFISILQLFEDSVRDGRSFAFCGAAQLRIAELEDGSHRQEFRVANVRSRVNECGMTIAECRMRAPDSQRSEERRVGKECRSRWSPY